MDIVEVLEATRRVGRQDLHELAVGRFLDFFVFDDCFDYQVAVGHDRRVLGGA